MTDETGVTVTMADKQVMKQNPDWAEIVNNPTFKALVEEGFF